jgi:predicted dehydrogenase
MNGERLTSVGLVGCGNWGRHILRDLVALDCDVTVVARSERSRKTAAEGGALDVVSRTAELPAVDGIVVATPISTHAATVEEALLHGVPVFVEKPLTDDPDDADRLAAAAPDRLFVMDKWRYHPGIELLAEIAGARELGRVVGLRTTRIGWGNPHDVDPVWVLVPHDLAIALEILGDLPSARHAVADGSDGYAHGLIGMLGAEPWLTLEVSDRSADRRREVTLICEEGIAVLPDGYSDHVQVFRSAAEPERRPISTEFPLLRELRAFVEHLRGGRPPRSSADEGAAVVRLIAELRALAGLSR